MSAHLTGLTDEQWAQFSALLDEALTLPASERESWLQSLPGHQAELLPVLRDALAAEARLAAGPAQGRPRLSDGDPEFLFEAGRHIGPYQLIEPLGRGGMGEVWRARRSDGSLSREVALKLPHTWLLNAAMRMRLSRERDILAGLSHPHVAQLYDAGIADDGQPWLALERVEGKRIDSYCRERTLTVAQRITLFQQVIEAVSAAHARLIVHRDLKPSNILVTDAGTVKLLDFGIAKLVNEQGSGESTELTRIAGRIATPDYAAPEQLADDTITVATDVYALGVILYELLSGRRPFASRRHAGTVDRSEVPLASTQVLSEHARQCGLSARGLSRALSRDLDAILLKALAPRLGDRYSSVERLGDDLRRHLGNQPIEARHISRLERSFKFVRRHRIALSVSALFACSIAGGVLAGVWQAQRATEEAARAKATSDFLIRVFNASGRVSIGDRPPGETTARELLDDMVDRLDTDLSEQPKTQVDLLATARQIYRHWYEQDRVEQTEQKYRQAVAQAYGPTDARIVESLIRQASMYMDYPDISPALPMLAEARELIDRGGLRGSLVEASWLTESGRHAFRAAGPAPQALDKLRRAMQIYERVTPDNMDQRWTRYFYGTALLQAEQFDTARDVTLKGIAMEDGKNVKRNDWLVAMQHIQLGHIERSRGDASAARQAYDIGADLALKTFGHEVFTTYEAQLWRATLMAWRGDDIAARELFEQELATLERPLASTDEGGAWFLLAYARFLIDRNEADRALPLLQEALAVRMTMLPSPITTADIRLSLGEAWAQRGETVLAGEAFHTADADYQEQELVDAEAALQARERWARYQLDHGDAAAAQPLFEDVLQHAGERRLPVVAQARMGLARVAHARGDAAAAKTLAQQAMADLDRVQALYDPALRAVLTNTHAELTP